MNKASVAENNVDPNLMPLDDISVANRLAKMYQAAGIDPTSAYDAPEEAILDFGPTGLRDGL
ncbi:hypothetical protein [Chitinophaga sp.]|uniref:hypothetical protein n=1 Tax=Chitinophaga sp. TaxID=1869181 RepID=UPI002F94C45F